jgi:hypothetical protein
MSTRSSAPDRSRSHRLHPRIEQVLSVRPPAHTGVHFTSETSVNLYIHTHGGRVHTLPMFARDGPVSGEEFCTQHPADALAILHVLQQGDTQRVRLVGRNALPLSSLLGQYLIAQVDMDGTVNRDNVRNEKTEFNWQSYLDQRVNLKYEESFMPHVSIVVKPRSRPTIESRGDSELPIKVHRQPASRG